MMKGLLPALAVMICMGYGSVSAQPPGYTSDVDTFGAAAGGEARIALAWGENLKPPSKYSRFIINLRDAMAKWSMTPVAIQSNFHISSPDLMKMTVVFISADRQFELSKAEIKNLKEYLSKGGFIVADDAGAGMSNSPSGASLRKMIQQVAGGKHLSPVPNSHEIYSSPLALGGPPQGSDASMQTVGEFVSSDGEVLESKVMGSEAGSLQGIFLNGRLAILYCNRGYTPKWNADSNNQPQLKFGVNLITYGMSRGK